MNAKSVSVLVLSVMLVLAIPLTLAAQEPDRVVRGLGAYQFRGLANQRIA
jgi:hypothetical protein